MGIISELLMPLSPNTTHSKCALSMSSLLCLLPPALDSILLQRLGVCWPLLLPPRALAACLCWCWPASSAGWAGRSPGHSHESSQAFPGRPADDAPL